MPRLFGRKLVCFYCNRRSAQDRKSGIRQWQCEQCEAVNHLDEHGEITDPPTPAQQTPLNTRYVRPIPPSHSPDTNLNDRSLFCPRCLQNQHIVNRALAEYLPPQDDPKYPDFERALPGYRKKMEQRFPQVCNNCAPAVEDRIRSTGYAAKTDHLRRMMDRTRGKAVTRESWSWKSLVVLLAGSGSFVNLIGYLSWHALGALPTVTAEDGLSDPDDPQSILQCFLQGASELHIRPSCNDLVQSFLPYGFGLSLLCVWWNPRMYYKLRGGYGRVVGRADYYKLQLITLATRFATWKLAANESTFTLEPQTSRAIHAFGLVLEILLSVMSYRTMQIDQQPLVSFQEHEPVLSNRSVTMDITAPQPGCRDLGTPSKSRVQTFPIEKLAPKALVQQPPLYQPPTPPPEEDAEDTGMDWTPQHNFRSAKAYNTLQVNPVFNEPSPFHGALPPAPVGWARRLRNPTQPAFHKASEEKKENFFGKRDKRDKRLLLSDDASDVSSSFSPKSTGFMSTISSPVKFAPPRFFAPADRMETGLESLFEDTFKLSKDTDQTVEQDGEDDVDSGVSTLASSPLTRLATSLLLCACCGAWAKAGVFLPAAAPSLRTGCQILAASISSLNAASSAALPRTMRSTGSATYYGVEAATAMSLGVLVWEPWGYGYKFDIGKLGLWFLIALTVQEVWDFFSSLLIPAPSARAQVEEKANLTKQDTQLPKQASKPAARSEPSTRPFSQAWKSDRSTAVSTAPNINNVRVSQRMTRPKTGEEKRRDSLGVDNLGSLSLGGW